MDFHKSIMCQIDVALSITKHLFSKEDYQDKSLIFSPFSLHAALSLMAAGSEGRTLNELLSFLRSDSVDISLPFSLRSSPSCCPTQLLLQLLDGTSVKVPFMIGVKKEQFIRAFDGFKVLRLSYKQGGDKKRRFSMYIFLPDAKDGLPALIEKMASESGFLEGKFPRRKLRVSDVDIPRFQISFTLEASDMLKELGVDSPFSQWNADFTKMVEVNSPLDKLYVESIFHKAFIEVNEKGTEAAAATIAPMNPQCLPMIPAVEFVADHPFLFLIREDFTGTILFVGQVLNPLVGAATPVKRRFDWKSPLYRASASSATPMKSYIDDDKPEVPPKRKRSSKDEEEDVK